MAAARNLGKLHAQSDRSADVTMNKFALTLALATAGVAGAANAGGLSLCDVRSDYQVRLRADAVEFVRADDRLPRQVRLLDGRLLLDGREVALGSADRERVGALEHGLRALLPAVREIALEAVGIAADALVQVATTLAGADLSATAARIESWRHELSARIAAGVDRGEFDHGGLEREFETLAAEFAAGLAGEVAAVAVKAALSGDEAGIARIERRAAELERALETQVEARARALEAQAETLCPQLRALERTHAALELRLADGRKLDLLERR